MAKKLETDIVLNLAGNLAAKARQYGNSMGDFAKKNQKAMRLVKTSTAAAGRGIDKLGNRYVGMATAFATGYVAKGLVSLDRRLSRLSIAAEVSKEKTSELYDEIQRVSNLEGIRIDPSESLSAIEEILTKTGDLEYAMNNLPNIATVIQATGAGGVQVGGIFTEFKKLAIDSSEAAMKAIDVLNKQGKSGAFTLASMANFGPQIFAAYSATGRQGAEAVTELGAALQVIRDGVGTDATAVTAFEALIRDLTEPERVAKLKQLGNINVFDPEQLKNGVEVMRPLPELMKEIIKGSQGLSKPLALLKFTDEARRAFNPLITEFKLKGDIHSFDDFMATIGDGSVTIADASVAAGDAAASVQLLNNSFNKFANQRLAVPIRELSDAINSIDDDTIQNWLKWGEAAAWAVGGLVVAKKGLDITNAAGRFLGKGKGKGGGAGGKGGFQDLGAMPVFVVNMPSGGFGGNQEPIIDTDNGNPKNKKGNRLGKAIRMAGEVFAVGFAMEALFGNTDFAKKMKATTLSDVFPNVFDDPSKKKSITEEKVNAYLNAASNQGLPSYLTGNSAQPSGQSNYPIGGNVNVKVDVSDSRITASATSSSPSIQIDPDTGIN